MACALLLLPRWLVYFLRSGRISELTTDREEVQLRDDVEADTAPGKAHSSLLATILAGAIMLSIGLLAGYFGRPLITPESADGMSVAAASTPTPSPAGNAEASAQGSPAGTLMDAVVAQTRHFKGSPDAPVTIIEFSDFQ